MLGFFEANGFARRGLLSRRAWIAQGPLKACFDPRALAINQVDACSALYSNRTVKKNLGLVDVPALSFETRNIKLVAKFTGNTRGKRTFVSRLTSQTSLFRLFTFRTLFISLR